jgi:hypothetical protein
MQDTSIQIPTIPAIIPAYERSDQGSEGATMTTQVDAQEVMFRRAASAAALVGYLKYQEMLKALEAAANLSEEVIGAFQDAQKLESCVDSPREFKVPYRVENVKDFFEKVVPHSESFLKPIRELQAQVASKQNGSNLP